MRTGKGEEDEIINTLTNQGRMRGALQEVEMAPKKPGRVKMEHKGEGNTRLDPLRAATQEHLREVVEVKVQAGASSSRPAQGQSYKEWKEANKRKSGN